MPAIGFYDGFLGPGTGSFFALAGVALRGEPLLKATVAAKVLNFGSNLGALVLFLLAGKVVWAYGAVMICGQILGATAGSHVMIRGGARLIRAADRWRLLRDDPALCVAEELSACPLTP